MSEIFFSSGTLIPVFIKFKFSLVTVLRPESLGRGRSKDGLSIRCPLSMGQNDKLEWAERNARRYELCNLPYIHTFEQNKSVECYDWKGLNRISYCSGHEIEPAFLFDRELWKELWFSNI